MKKDGQLSNLASFAHDQYLHFLHAEDGLTIVEYAIAASLIATAIAVSFGTLRVTVDAPIVGIAAAL